jgi:hypothetical protein
LLSRNVKVKVYKTIFLPVVFYGFPTMSKARKVYKVLVGKPEGKITLGRLRRRWEDGIRMDLRKSGWGECVVVSGLVAGSLNTVMNIRVLAPRS